jgi:hypothetical protein
MKPQQDRTKQLDMLKTGLDAVPAYGSAEDPEEENMKRIRKYTDQLKSPETFKQALDQSVGIPADLSPIRKKVYDERHAELDSLMKTVKENASTKENRTEWMEVAELLGQSLIQMATAKKGLQTGVDTVTGLKFKPTDWANKYDRIQTELKTKLAPLVDEKRNVLREQEREEDSSARERSRIAQAILQKYYEDVRAGKKSTKDAEKKEFDVAKEYDKMLRNAERDVERFDTTKEEYKTKLKGLKEQYESGELDEDKFTKEQDKVMVNIAKQLGATAEDVQKAKEQSVDNTGFFNTLFSKVGWTEKAADPIEIVEWLDSRPAPEITDAVKAALRDLADPAVSPEAKSEMRDILRKRGFKF